MRLMESAEVSFLFLFRLRQEKFKLCWGLNFHPLALAYAASTFGPLAQSVEQLAFNQLVAGSNPARPTIYTEPPSGGFFYDSRRGEKASVR